MDYLTIFRDQAKLRSAENQKAFEVLINNGCYGVAAGLLRQELDTLIRVTYLCYEDLDIEYGRQLIKDSVEGRRWKKINLKGKSVPITDREMVNLAKHLGGWEGYVYDFGCKFIHLSDAHYYEFVDPIEKISTEDKELIISYLKEKHEYPHEELTFELVKPFLPSVMEKIANSIEFFSEEFLDLYGNQE
ncbi:hypothetical protein [Zobellella endophytica]|uniref:hypothetical protein n=1 Tax=Zobellella endophytica TaxID=2116700 RepID=UPI0011B25EBF|nr:hypothetical protein [Zobellella endophytica]